MLQASDHETWPASTPRIGGFQAPYGWRVVRIERVGPFPVRVVWQLPDGSQRAWESRGRRLRKELAAVPSVLLDATARVRPPLVAWA
ncbi:MAG TPA: hypothetical protein VE152_05675, partial [Acidimicrobiales bacterium]|nr:hypothetical protein [Acidimicrobiales bacterium]